MRTPDLKKLTLASRTATIKRSLIIVLLSGFSGLLSCNNKPTGNTPQARANAQKMTDTADTLKQILEAFNRHDLDAIMKYFTDDCSFDFPRGPDPWGQRFTGKAQVREALAGRFKGIPDVHYGEDRHWVSADGGRGESEWTLTGTTVSGLILKLRGCDLWELRDGQIARKDSYWKIVEPAAK
jgi:steroid delta-isomerase-like uncharacterized protein